MKYAVVIEGSKSHKRLKQGITKCLPHLFYKRSSAERAIKESKSPERLIIMNVEDIL